MLTNREITAQCDPEQRAVREFTDKWLGVYFNNYDTPTPLICSFRAEVAYDVALLIKTLCELDIAFKINWWLDFGIPDVAVELITEVDVDRLREIMRSQIDMHIMIQTLRPVPLKDNSLERDNTIDW